MNHNFNFPTTYVQSIRVRSSVPISTTTEIDSDTISNLIQSSISSGTGVGTVDLDNVSSSTISNLSTNSISVASKTFISINSDTIIKANLLIGSSIDNSIDSNYKLQVNGNVLFDGDEFYINSDNVKITDNVIGIGVNNSSVSNFLNGVYFPKTDTFSGLGISPDRVGILSFPFGTFQSSSVYSQTNSTLKRFNNNKNSIRFAYIENTLDLDTPKTTSNPFSINEMNYINSLNNSNNTQSNYFVNIEADNITCHGGNFISGISKDLVLIATDGNNNEIKYLTCSLSNSAIQLEKNLETMVDDFSIINKSVININDATTSQFKFSNSSHSTLRNIDFTDNNSTNSNITFGNSSGSTQKTFSISYKQDPVIKINSNETTSNKLELKTKTEISGPDQYSDNYPIFSFYNINSNVIINSSYPPIVKNYIQSKNISNGSNQTFAFSDILNTGYQDLIFVAYLIISNDSSVKFLNLKIEGALNARQINGTTTVDINKTETILSIKNITYTDSSSPDVTVSIDGITSENYSTSTNTFNITITNNLSVSLDSLVKIEFTQM